MEKERKRKSVGRPTEITRPIFLNDERCFCDTKKTPVASDLCWMCEHNKRLKYDPTKPKETVECEMWYG